MTEAPFLRLTACLAAGDATGDFSWQSSEEGWGPVLSLASHHLVTPVLAGELQRRRVFGSLPDDVQQYLSATRELNAIRNAKLRGELGVVAQVLNGIGIQPVLLKGAIALAVADYQGSEDRMVGDLDLLVPPARVAEARAALVARGYREAREEWRQMLPRDIETSHHAIPLLHPHLPVSVELHTRILAEAADDGLLSEGLRCSEVRINDGASAMIPDRETRLLHNLFHEMISNRAATLRSVELRQLLEFAAVASSAQGDIDLQRMLMRMRPRRRQFLALRWALAERWLGLLPAPGLPHPLHQRAEVWLFERSATQRRWQSMFLAYDKVLRLPRRFLNEVSRTLGKAR